MASRKRGFGSADDEALFATVAETARVALEKARGEWEEAQTRAEATKSPSDVATSLRLLKVVREAKATLDEANEALAQARGASAPAAKPSAPKRARKEESDKVVVPLDKALDSADSSSDDSVRTPLRCSPFAEKARLAIDKDRDATHAADDAAVVVRRVDLPDAAQVTTSAPHAVAVAAVAADASASASAPVNAPVFERSPDLLKSAGSRFTRFYHARGELLKEMRASSSGRPSGFSPLLRCDESLRVGLVGQSVNPADGAAADTAEAFYKAVLGDIENSAARIVFRGKSDYDSYKTKGDSPDIKTVVVDPYGAFDALIYIAGRISKHYWSDASAERTLHRLTLNEGILFYVLWKAKTVDVLALCSGLYRDEKVKTPFAAAFAYLLRWGQHQAHRVTFTCSDWAAEFLATNFEEMTGVELPFKVLKNGNDDRVVNCVGDREKALTCELNALRAAAMCVKAGERLELPIKEMDSATKAEFSDRADSPYVRTKVFLCTTAKGERVIWTSTFAPLPGVDAGLKIVWSTKHLCEVRGVRNVDRERSAAIARSTIPGEDGELLATQIEDGDDDEAEAAATQVIQSQAPGSAFPSEKKRD